MLFFFDKMSFVCLFFFLGKPKVETPNHKINLKKKKFYKKFKVQNGQTQNQKKKCPNHDWLFIFWGELSLQVVFFLAF